MSLRNKFVGERSEEVDGPDTQQRAPILEALREVRAEAVMSPAEAFFSRTTRVPLNEAAGRIAAEMISP